MIIEAHLETILAGAIKRELIYSRHCRTVDRHRGLEEGGNSSEGTERYE